MGREFDDKIRELAAGGMDPVEICCELLVSWRRVERVLGAAAFGQIETVPEGGAAAPAETVTLEPGVAAPPRALHRCMRCGRHFHRAETEAPFCTLCRAIGEAA